MSLQGKTAVVCGGGTGIGAGIALAFARAGAQVIVAGRREDKLREVAVAFEGEPAIGVRACDVSNRADVGALFDWVEGEFGAVDILVNSAGVNTKKRTMSDLSPDDWDRVLQINATGAYNTIYRVLPGMRKRRDGLIINISSIAGVRAAPLGGVAYNASKFAMSALGTSVREEERVNGIRVTNIYPGEVETPILDNRPVPVTAEHRARILQPEDIAAAALMVAQLPPRAEIPDLVIIPSSQSFI